VKEISHHFRDTTLTTHCASVYAFSIDFATVTWIIHRSHQAGKRDAKESVLIETLMWLFSENLE